MKGLELLILLVSISQVLKLQALQVCDALPSCIVR